MHFLFTQIYIPEVQRSKLKSISNEYLLSCYKHLFQLCNHGLRAPLLQVQLVQFLEKIHFHLNYQLYLSYVGVCLTKFSL